MNVFKFSIPTLICITCIVSSVAPHDSPDSPVLVKFSKSFYQNHDLDTISKGTDTTISPNSLADSSHEVSNEGECGHTFDLVFICNLMCGTVDCHRAAVSRCGHILIRVFKFLDYLNARESFQPRCAFREVGSLVLAISSSYLILGHRRSSSA